jgi:hypothetical protein
MPLKLGTLQIIHKIHESDLKSRARMMKCRFLRNMQKDKVASKYLVEKMKTKDRWAMQETKEEYSRKVTRVVN